ALTCAKADEEKRASLWLTYKLILSKIDFKPEKIHQQLTRLNDLVETDAKELISPLDPKPRGIWKPYTDNFYYPDSVPDRFIKFPRLSIKSYKKILIEFQKLSSRQSESIAFLKDKTSEKIYSKNEKGETILISAIEWYSKMRIAGEIIEEKELVEAMLQNQIEGAKNRLKKAIQYVNVRQSDKSLAVGEKSVVGETRYLYFKDIKKYSKDIQERVTELEAEGNAPDSIIDLCLTASLNLEQKFEEWARIVFDKQFTFNGIQAYLKELEESQETKIKVTKEVVDQVTNIFKESIPKSWNNADWESLEKTTKEVDEILGKMKSLVTDLGHWGEKITNLEINIQDVLFMEKQLKMQYGETLRPSKQWSKYLASWENGEFSALWAIGHLDVLEGALRELEISLLEYDERLRNVLPRTEEPSKIVTPTQPIVEKPGSRYTIRHSTNEKVQDREGFPVAEPQRSHKPPSFEPEKKLPGKRVKAKTPYSDDIIEVDISFIGQGFELVEPTFSEEED
ncbi:hypothetical protein DRH13_04930, partial [Candidatus Woesebacteria bacterium]